MPCPPHLELEYDLVRNGIGIGEVNRTLQRRADSSYVHTMWTRPTGLARLLTQIEWREEGEIIVQGTDVLPQRFSETRAGDKRAYEHRVTFDRAKPCSCSATPHHSRFHVTPRTRAARSMR